MDTDYKYITKDEMGNVLYIHKTKPYKMNGRWFSKEADMLWEHIPLPRKCMKQYEKTLSTKTYHVLTPEKIRILRGLIEF